MIMTTVSYQAWIQDSVVQDQDPDRQDQDQDSGRIHIDTSTSPSPRTGSVYELMRVSLVRVERSQSLVRVENL